MTKLWWGLLKLWSLALRLDWKALKQNLFRSWDNDMMLIVMLASKCESALVVKDSAVFAPPDSAQAYLDPNIIHCTIILCTTNTNTYASETSMTRMNFEIHLVSKKRGRGGLIYRQCPMFNPIYLYLSPQLPFLYHSTISTAKHFCLYTTLYVHAVE